jgi:hypothetical protein
MRNVIHRLVTSFVLAGLLCGSIGFAQSPTTPPENLSAEAQGPKTTGNKSALPKGNGISRGKNGSSGNEVDIDPARRENAMKFVDEHQPQLRRLMGVLEKNRPAQYRRAMSSLVREVERLQELQERDSDRFANALALWNNQKATEYLSAQIALRGENDELREKLRKLIAERRALLLAGVDAEMRALENRLGRLEKQKEEMSRETDIDRRVDQVIAQAKKMKNERGAQRANDASAKPSKDK